MARYVLAQAATNPDKTALEILSTEGRKTWIYQQLESDVLSAAGGLKELGLPQGSRILLRLGNEVEFPILFLAAIAAGFVPVPSSTSLKGPEVEAIVRDLQPALVLTSNDAIAPELSDQHVLGPKEIAELFIAPLAEYVLGDPDRPAYIIYTSGTSGRPMGVVHAHRAVWARRMMWRDWYDLRPSDRLMHAGAFNWTYTLGTGLMDPWAMGATAQIPAVNTTSDQLIDLMKTYQTTIFAAAPGVYRQIVKSLHVIDLPDLRHGLSAGEKLSESLRADWSQKTKRPIFEALGMSEISTYVSSSPFHPTDATYSGYPQQGRRLAIVTEDGQIVSHQTPGILAISRRDPGLMLGYLNAPNETEAKFSGEWFLTGDMAEMAEDGAITYLGRNDDMMNAGGFRVSPIEVERTLNEHPDIVESAAAMIEIKPNAFVIAAFYQSGVDLPDKDLADWCNTRLARYKCPRVFRRVKALPKGANNKIRRNDLRQSFRGSDDQA